ncbi:hypothetical protein DXT76_20830, partial [Halobacillus trueperi]
ALPRKASHSPQPHPLNKSLETESSTNGSFSEIKEDKKSPLLNGQKGVMVRVFSLKGDRP